MTAPEPSTPDPSIPDRAEERPDAAACDRHSWSRHGRAGHGGPNRVWRRWLPLLLLVLGTTLFFVFDLYRYVSVAKLRAHHEELEAFVAAHYLAALALYAATYVVFVALSLPGAVWLTIFGGFLFGAAVAAIVTVFAATLGASLLFLAAKTSLGAYLHSHAGPWLSKVERGFAENQWSYMLMMRLFPAIPFFIANLVPAFLGVPLHVFAIATFVGIIPATAIFAALGGGLESLLDSSAEPTLQSLLTPEIKLALAGLALLAALPILLKLWRRHKRGHKDA